METIGDMEYFSLEEITDKYIGKPGTKEREEFDARVDRAVEEYHLGEAVRDARISLNLTQEQLGEMIGVRKSQVSRIESGKCQSYSTLKRVFRALGIRPTLNTGFGCYPIF